MITYFFLIFAFTILITRVYLYVRPTSSPTIGRFRLHHYMFGLAGVVLGIAFSSLTVFAIGLGLFVDELAFLLMRGKTHEDNYSKASLLGTLFFVAVVFYIQEYLLSIFYSF